MTFSRNRVVTIQPSPPPTTVTALPLQLQGGTAGCVFVRHCWYNGSDGGWHAACFYRPIYDRRIVVNTQQREPIKNQLFSSDGNGWMIYIYEKHAEKERLKKRKCDTLKNKFSTIIGVWKLKKRTRLICKNRLICTDLNNCCSK